MKIRLLALAGVAAVALSTPALAGDGWYLGLGAGWDHQNSMRFQPQSPLTPPPAPIYGKSSDSALIAGAFGYKFDNGIRLEWEDSYASHDFTGNISGSSSTTAAMINGIYDLPLGDNWMLSLGGGVGLGEERVHSKTTIISTTGTQTTTATGDLAIGKSLGLEWQAR